MGFPVELEPPQHLELCLGPRGGLQLIAGLRCRGAGNALGAEGLELHRICPGDGGRLDEPRGEFWIACVLTARLGDHEAGRARTNRTSAESHQAVQPPSTTRLCPVT